MSPTDKPSDKSPTIEPAVTKLPEKETKSKTEFVKIGTLEDEKKTRADELLKQMNAKLAEAGGESNLGVTDEYWDMLREYRKLTAK